MGPMTGGSIVWILDADTGQFSKALMQAEQQAESAASTIDGKLNRSAQNASSSFGDLARSVAQTAWGTFQVGAMAATTAMMALATKGVTSGFQLQTLQLQMEGLTKSFKLGSKAMAGAFEYVQNAPFKLESAAAATKTMIAFGMSVDDSVERLKLLGDISITSGVPMEHLASIFGRVSAQGRLMGGDIQQLTENGIAILPKLQQQLGKTAEEVRDMAANGEISFKQFSDAMSDLVDPKITEKLENTLPRQLDRLAGSWRNASSKLVGYSVDAENGFVMSADGILQAATTLTKNLADTLRTPEVFDALERLGLVFAPVIRALGDFFKVTEVGGVKTSKASKLIAGFLNMLASLGPALIPILGALAISSTQLMGGLPFLGASLQGIGAGFNDTAVQALRFLNPFQKMPNLLGGTSIAMSSFSGMLGRTKTSLFGFGGAASATGEIIGKQPGLFSKLGSSIGGVSSKLPAAQAGISNLGGVAKEMGGRFLTAGSVIPHFNTAVLSGAGAMMTAGIKADTLRGRLGLLPGVLQGGVAKGLDTVGGKLGTLGGRFGVTTGRVGMLTGAIGPFLSVLQPLQSLLPSASTAMGALGGAAGLVGDGLGLVAGLASKAASGLAMVFGVIGRGLLVMAPVAILLGGLAYLMYQFAKSSEMTATEVQAHFQSMTENILSSIQSWVNGLGQSIPAFTAAFSEIIAGIVEMLPVVVYMAQQIVEQLVTSLTEQLPMLIEFGSDAVAAVMSGIATVLPMIFQAALDIITALGQGLLQNLPILLENFALMMGTVIAQLGQTAVELVKIGGDLILGLIQGLVTALPMLLSMAQTIITDLITTIVTILPLMLTTGVQVLLALINGILTAIPQIITTAVSIINTLVTQITILLPLIVQAGLQLLQGIISGIITNLPLIITAVLNLITTILTAITTLLPMILMAGVQLLIALINGIVEALPTIIAAVAQIIDTLVVAITTMLPLILEAGIQILMAIVQAIVDNLPAIIDATILLIMTLIQAVIDNLPLIIDTIVILIGVIANAMIDNLPLIIKAAFQIIGAIVRGLIQMIPQLLAAGLQLVISLASSLISNIPELVVAAKDLVIAAIKAIPEAFGGLVQVGKDFVQGLANGIGDAKDAVINKVKEIASGALDAIKNFFGIKSPSRVMAQMGNYMMEGLHKGIEKTGQGVLDTVDTLAHGISDRFNALDSHDLKYDAQVNGQINDVEGLSQVISLKAGSESKLGQVNNTYNITLPNVRDGNDFVRELKLAVAGKG